MQPGAWQNWGHVFGPGYWNEQERLDDAVAKLGAVRDAGICTIVDPTAPGLGRYIPRIQKLNAAVDLNIIVATGVYAFLELPNFPAYRSVEAIADLFVREIREGISATCAQSPAAALGSAAIASASSTSTRCPIALRPCSPYWPRGTALASTCRTMPPASTTS